MHQVISLRISGIGIILYSPWAVAGIEEGSDYLTTRFMDASDVGEHVRACSLTGLGTGSSGNFQLHLSTEAVDASALQAAEYKVAIGLEVRDGVVCIRDLYDLMKWRRTCPPGQTVCLDSGFYHITAYTSAPPSGVLGDQQIIHLCFRQVPERPALMWQGVPQLC